MQPRHAGVIATIRNLTICSLVAVLLSGCAVTTQRPWGSDATLAPGWQRVGTAAVDALSSPWTWGPALGAAACGIGKVDQEVSEWAQQETPIFGSPEQAGDASDALVRASRLTWQATGLISPSGETAGTWAWNKTKGFAVGYAALKTTEWSTSALKQSTKRTRPDASDTSSFPSGHTSGATVTATLAARNLDYLPLPPAGLTTGRIAIGAMAVGTGWARIEAGKHYPSDVLAGAALGHFIGAFLNDAFLGLAAQPTLELSPDDVFVGLTWAYE